MLQLQRRQQHRGVHRVSGTRDRISTSTQTATVQVVMSLGITRMDPPPAVINIDQNLLVELQNNFPNIPHRVIISLIQENQNNRERCMLALTRESQKFPVTPEKNQVYLPVPDCMQQINSSAAPQMSTVSPIPGAQYSEVGIAYNNPQLVDVSSHVPNPGTGAMALPGQQLPGELSCNRTMISSPLVRNCPGPPASTLPPSSSPLTPGSISSWNVMSNVPSQTGINLGQFPAIFPPSHYKQDKNVALGSHHSFVSDNMATTTQAQSCVISPTSSDNHWSEFSLQKSTPTTSITTTFVSQVNKYIGPQGSNSINITVQPQSTPFSMKTLVTALPTGKSLCDNDHTMSYQSGVWRSDGSVAVKPPTPLSDVGTQLSSVLPVSGATDMPPALTMSNIASSIVAQGSEDTAYKQSLVLHQRSRLKKLQEDYQAALKYCEKLRMEVEINEKRVLERRKSRSGIRPSISMTDLQKVQEENRSLQIDSHILLMEFDRLTKGEPVIGQDRNENFYARIPGGQKDVLPTPKPSDNKRAAGSAFNRPTASVNEPPSHPPAPPSLVSAGHEPSQGLHNVHEAEEESWNCSACTFANHPELLTCEICSMPRLGHR